MEKQRDYFMDNAKMILIFLVVISHLCAFNSDIRDFGYLLIYSFHMPAFLFVCGYFSQKHSTLNNVKKLLIPYLILQIIWFIFSITILNLDKDFTFFIPAYSLWFLISLFFMKQILPFISKIKYILPVLFILGILVGYDNNVGSFLSLSRFIVFLPFFYMGYIFNRDKFVEFTDKYKVRLLALLTFIVLGTFLYLVQDIIRPELFYSKIPYESFKNTLPFTGGIMRLFMYIFSIIMGLCFFAMIPRTKNFLTYVGGATMGIYVIHPFIVTILKHNGFYKHINTPLEMILCVIGAILLTILLANKKLNKIVSLIFRVPIEKLFKKDQKAT